MNWAWRWNSWSDLWLSRSIFIGGPEERRDEAQNILCKAEERCLLGCFHECNNDECLLGYYTRWFYLEPTFRRHISPQSSGWSDSKSSYVTATICSTRLPSYESFYRDIMCNVRYNERLFSRWICFRDVPNGLFRCQNRCDLPNWSISQNVLGIAAHMPINMRQLLAHPVCANRRIGAIVWRYTTR
jgi:hypothetical protein